MTLADSQAGNDTIDVIEHSWIPLPDGCRLAARIWLPRCASTDPVPAVLEYLPYRKRDGTAIRDSGVHPYFAEAGFASVRVDIRGTGDSEGRFDDEYSPQEHADALAVIDWLATQPWCTGSVGMMGISWGGFNSLQVAALRPPALKAIITTCSTDDRYNDDCHYMGGSVVGDDMLPWATSLLAIVTTPPDRSGFDDQTDFLGAWKARIDGIEPPAHIWLGHQSRDAYWRYGSVCEEYSAIEAATLVVGGWADGYRNAAVRLLENLTCPRRGIIGPWAHRYPHIGRPGPAMDFVTECIRWWKYWLSGCDTGAMDTPLLRTWVNDWDQPSSDIAVRSGRWVGLNDWSDQPRHPLFLGSLGLSAEPPPTASVTVAGHQDSGLESGAWCSYGNAADQPPDQRSQDGLWKTFDSEPLKNDLTVFGFPRFQTTVASNRPEASLCVRVCDVAPDGSSLLVSEGLLNLNHRQGHELAQALTPGAPMRVTITLNASAHRFQKGHRIRLAVSPTYFPRTWPSPENAMLTLVTGEESHLSLPMLPASTVSVQITAPPTEQGPRVAVETVRPGSSYREVTRRYGENQEARLTVVSDGGLNLINGSTLHGSTSRDVFRIKDRDPLSAIVECERSYTVGSTDHPATVEIKTSLTASAEAFHLHTKISAFLGDELVHERELRKRIARLRP